MRILRIEKNGKCNIKNPLHNYVYLTMQYSLHKTYFSKQTCAILLALSFVEPGTFPFTLAQKIKV